VPIRLEAFAPVPVRTQSALFVLLLQGQHGEEERDKGSTPSSTAFLSSSICDESSGILLFSMGQISERKKEERQRQKEERGSALPGFTIANSA
jgi:hypothetical protein